jgi:hypothetical protein
MVAAIVTTPMDNNADNDRFERTCIPSVYLFAPPANHQRSVNRVKEEQIVIKRSLDFQAKCGVADFTFAQRMPDWASKTPTM